MTSEELVMLFSKNNCDTNFWLTRKQTNWLYDVWQNQYSTKLQKLSYGGYPSDIHGESDKFSYTAVKSHTSGTALLTIKSKSFEPENTQLSYVDEYFLANYSVDFKTYLKSNSDAAVAAIFNSTEFKNYVNNLIK